MRIIFHFFEIIMWIFLGPEHNILRSTAAGLGTLIIKYDISAFWNRVICLNHYAHASHLLLVPERTLGDMLALPRQTLCVFTPWKAIFQDPIIVDGSTSVVTQQQIPQPIRTAALCPMVFHFLAYLLWCLLQTVYVPVAKCLFRGSFLTESLPEILAHLARRLPCLCVFICPDTDINLIFNGVITRIIHGSVQLSCRRKRNFVSLPLLHG